MSTVLVFAAEKLPGVRQPVAVALSQPAEEIGLREIARALTPVLAAKGLLDQGDVRLTYVAGLSVELYSPSR